MPIKEEVTYVNDHEMITEADIEKREKKKVENENNETTQGELEDVNMDDNDNENENDNDNDNDQEKESLVTKKGSKNKEKETTGYPGTATKDMGAGNKHTKLSQNDDDEQNEPASDMHDLENPATNEAKTGVCVCVCVCVFFFFLYFY